MNIVADVTIQECNEEEQEIGKDENLSQDMLAESDNGSQDRPESPDDICSSVASSLLFMGFPSSGSSNSDNQEGFRGFPSSKSSSPFDPERGFRGFDSQESIEMVRKYFKPVTPCNTG